MMIDPGGRPVDLVLFFTRGMSLQAWDEVGMFSREVAIYRQLQRAGVRVSFITYGDRRELAYAERLPGIRICCNRWGVPRRWYERMLPMLHRQVLHGADVIKTNQTNGADIALQAARRYHKPLIARCGYMWSKNAILEHGADSPLARRALSTETEVFVAADAVVVTSEEMKGDLCKRISGIGERVSIIPNYVDTEVFKPAERAAGKRPRLCFVGRLAPEKNLKALLTAIDDLEVELDIVGQGPLRSILENQASDNPRVRFLGRRANEDLPAILNNCTAFVFPSLYEGHPKTPLEAMACGLPVISTEVSGTREIIAHGETGWFSPSDPSSLRSAIKRVLGDPQLQARLGGNARRFVVDHLSLDRVVEKEMRLYSRLLRRMPRC